MTQCGFEVWNLLARCCAWVQHTDKRIARIHVDQSGHNVHHHVKKRGERERERKSINLLAWAHTTALPSSSSSVSSTLKWSELREGASSNNASVTGACRKNSSNNHRGAPDGKHASQSGATSATQFEDTQKKIKKQQINLCVISSPLPRLSLYNDGFLDQLSSIKPNCIENPQFHQLPTCQRLSTVMASFHNVHQSLPWWSRKDNTHINSWKDLHHILYNIDN